MTNYFSPNAIVMFTEPLIDLTTGGDFDCILSIAIPASDLSLVIDIYDMDNPIHPEGHLGWWKFSLTQIGERFSAYISHSDHGLLCEIKGMKTVSQWVNEGNVEFKRLVVNAVLRSNITNGIVYLDQVPAFKNSIERDTFRMGFSRDWNSPSYAPASFVMTEGVTIRIVCRNVFNNDAVGNFCLEVYRCLKQNGIQVALYAENFDLTLNDFIHKIDHIFQNAKSSDQLLYFSSTYDPALGGLLSLPFARKVAFFHGITPPELLQVFDLELSNNCHRAYKQLACLEEFDVLATNSRASAEFLLSFFEEGSRFGKDDIKIIPPCLQPQTKQAVVSPAEIDLTHYSLGARLLFVGRIKSHKKIEDLLKLLSAYRKFDESSELWIVGSGADKAYRDYLIWVQEHELELPPESVKWFGSVSNQQLADLYINANVYVNMSEHEGFCIPLFEAMQAGLPVFSYGTPAILETLEGSGIFFVEKNYAHIASKIKSVLDDPIHRSSIVVKQKLRAAKLAADMDGQAILDLIKPELYTY